MFGRRVAAPKAELPDTWTPERRERFRVLDAAGGNVEVASFAWAGHQRELFVRWLVTTRRLDDWRVSDRSRGVV